MLNAPENGTLAAGPPPWVRDVLVLLVLASALVAVHAGYPGLADPDEPRSALIARLMVERGDWLAPHLPVLFLHDYPRSPVEGDTLAYWDKPPLYFWLAALGMKALGPTALAARLPSALGHVGSVLLAYAIGRWIWGRRAGLLAGAALAVAPLAVVLGNVARMEALLVFLMTAMLLAILRLLGDRSRSWLWTIVLYGAAGLGLLTKGPVAVILPAVAVVGSLLLCGRVRDLGRLRPVAGLAIMLLVAAPWFVAMHYRYPPGAGGTQGFLHTFFISQNVERAATGGFGHSGQVPGYLLGVLLVGFVPWTIFLPGMLRHFLALERRGRWRVPVLRAATGERFAVVLLLAWAVVIVGAFSVSKTQLPHYIAPAIAPLAVLMGAYLAEKTRMGAVDRLFTIGLWITTVAGAAASMGILLVARPGLAHGIGIAGLLVFLIAAVAIGRGRLGAAVGLGAAGMGLIIALVFVGDPYGFFARSSTLKQAQLVADRLQPGDALVAFPRVPYSLAWYLWPREIRMCTVTDEPGGEPSVPKLLADLRKPRVTYCLLQKKALAALIQTEVRAPVELLTRPPDQVLIRVGPSLPEEKPHGP